MKHLRTKIVGMSLVEVMVALAVLVVASTGYVLFKAKLSKQRQELQRSRDVDDLKQNLQQSIDCAATYSAHGITAGNFSSQCLSTTIPLSQAAPFLRLRRCVGRKTNAGVCRSTTDWLTQAPDATSGELEFRAFRLRITCSAAENTLIVVARPNIKLPGEMQSPDIVVFGKGERVIPLCPFHY